MHITFFIGNGFDLNLGLNTKYSDFIEKYKELDSNNPTIQEFRKEIQSSSEQWACAETELGKHTKKYKVGQAQKFSDCHTDFCNNLADYLKKQESRIDFDAKSKWVLDAFRIFDSFHKKSSGLFADQEHIELEEIFNLYRQDAKIFHFVVFNYTKTIDKCYDIIWKEKGVLGQCTFANAKDNYNVLGQCFHVHGTTEQNMIFGVADISQIKNPKIFEKESKKPYLDLLIKEKADQLYKTNQYKNAKEYLKLNTIIFIYGMSIGETDKIWWEYICEWLEKDQDRRVIIYSYDIKNEPMPTKKMIAIAKIKNDLLKHAAFSEDKKKQLEKRIYVTDRNIFKKLENLVYFPPT